MIEIGGGITIGGSIIIGEVPALITADFFITETGDNLISESGEFFITEG
jgi:hypothetical protein